MVSRADLCAIFALKNGKRTRMFGVFIYQLPFTVCIAWLLIVVVRGCRYHADRLLASVMLLLSIGFFSGANNLSVNPDLRRQVIMNTVLEFTSLAVVPLVCFYIRSLVEDVYERALSYLMLLPAVLITTANVLLICIMGLDNTAELFNGLFHNLISPDDLDRMQKVFVLVSYLIYRAVFLVMLVAAMMFMVFWLRLNKFRPGHVWGFLKKGRTSFTANIVCVLFMVYFALWGLCIVYNEPFLNIYSPWSVAWSVSVAVVLFLVGYVVTVPSLPGGYMTKERLRHPFTAIRQTTQEYLGAIDSGPIAEGTQSGYDKLMESFKQLMIVDKGYLDPSLSVDEISRQLNTNRTYVSKLVNVYYGMPFRDYLNHLRIEYAKQLMTDEPDAVIDYISVKSGFQSSTQFIRKFRELEGLTPTVWKSTLHKR